MPEAELPPGTPFASHSRSAAGSPDDVAVNCNELPAPSAAVWGEMETEAARADPFDGSGRGTLTGSEPPQPREIRYKQQRARRGTAGGSVTRYIALVRSHQKSPTSWPYEQILGRIDSERKVPEVYGQLDMYLSGLGTVTGTAAARCMGLFLIPLADNFQCGCHVVLHGSLHTA